MKVRLRTDERGIPHCENAETGERLLATAASIDMGPVEVTAVVHLCGPVVDVVCDATIKDVRHLVFDQNDLESIAAAMTVLVKRRNELERL